MKTPSHVNMSANPASSNAARLIVAVANAAMAEPSPIRVATVARTSRADT